MKVNLNLKKHHNVILAKYVNTFLKLCSIMAIENLRKHLIFSTLKFEYKNFGGKKKTKNNRLLGTTVAVKLSFAV